MRHGWRYLGLLPKQVLELTHKEFSILCEENVERTYDVHEHEAAYAIMYAVASRGKGKSGKIPTLSELYKRPTSEVGSSDKLEDMVEKQREAKDWLSRFEIES